MAKSTFSGPLVVGTVREGASANIGGVSLMQRVYIVPAASVVDGKYKNYPAVAWTGAASASTIALQLPASASITDIVIDQPTLTTGGTAINLTSGISAAGVEYVASTDVKATVRLRPTFTAAHLTAMADITTNTGFYVQVTPTISGVTAGVLSVTVMYTQAV